MRKIILMIMLITLMISGCHNENREIKSLDDLKTARIGAWPESGYELKARAMFPNAKIVNLDFLSDLVQSLKQNKIDAFVVGKSYAENLKYEGVEVDYLPQSLGDVPISYIFPKNERGQKICSQMNEFIALIEANGELDELKNKWLRSDESKRIFTKSKLSGENGKVIICTDAQSPPFVYLREGQIVGFEAEIIDKFCANYGYDYEIKVENFLTMLADVTTGKVDFGMDAFEILPEREKNMMFANPIHVEQAVAVINSESSGVFNITARIKSSLIDESRWKMILDGTLTTLTITFFSIIFGTLLGLAIYLLYREKTPANRLIDAIYRTLQGVPMMVLLLFFYYVIFGSINLPASAVAVVVFSIVMSISVFTMIKSGAESISGGQMEAALSLGFSERRAFIKFILPQVIRNNFANYQLQLNAIMLETAIVGYIAVQDLTRMADLIRARTYDAFIPIITIALVYLLLSKLLFLITDIISRKIESKNRKKTEILRGVKL